MATLTIRITEHDTEMRFRTRAGRGDSKRGLELLDELDRHHATRTRR